MENTGIHLDKVIGWLDIFKGLGQVAVEMVTKQFTHQGLSEHHVPELTPVQKDANAWVEKMGFGHD